MKRSRGYFRNVRIKAIKRKKNKINDPYWFKYDGQYSKGKIHCSCWQCRYGGWNHQDAMRESAMDASLAEYENGLPDEDVTYYIDDYDMFYQDYLNREWEKEHVDDDWDDCMDDEFYDDYDDDYDPYDDDKYFPESA